MYQPHDDTFSKEEKCNRNTVEGLMEEKDLLRPWSNRLLFGGSMKQLEIAYRELRGYRAGKCMHLVVVVGPRF